MALTQLPIELSIPPAWFSRVPSTTPTELTNVMNALDEILMLVFRVPAAITLRKISFKTTAVSSFVGTAQVRVETVGATGLPTGTLVAANTNASFTPSVSTQTVQLTADATLSAGDMVAVGIRITAYTSGSFTVAQDQRVMTFSLDRAFPYGVVATSTKIAAVGAIGVELSDGSKLSIPGAGGVASTMTDYSWASNSNPDRRGVRWKQPFTGECVGFSNTDVTYLNDWKFLLYDTDGTTVLLDSGTLDGDHNSGTRGFRTYGIAPTELTKDSVYRLVILPLTTTSRLALSTITVADAASMAYFPGGSDWQYTTANGAPTAEGDWTNSTTEKPIGLFLHFRSIDLGGAGGLARIIGG